MSLDGYIAKPGDNLDFLSLVNKEGEDYGYHDFIKSTDVVIMGRKTYDWVMKMVSEFPHADMETYIFTRTPAPKSGNIHFYSGDAGELVKILKKRKGKNIFIDGGAEIVNLFMKKNLIDEFIISVIPVFTGDGIRLFEDGRPDQNLHLISSKDFETGLVQLHYKRK